MATKPKDPQPSPLASALRPLIAAIQVITGPWTRENGASWIKLVLFVLTVWWLFLQPFRIPTGSMEPILHGDERFFVGDRVFVNKLIYGPRIPFTTIRLWNWGGPRRFDVVVFRTVEPAPPAKNLWGKAINLLLPKVLIKRVVGLPGERVHLADGQLYINGEHIELPEAMRKAGVYYVGAVTRSREELIAEKIKQHPDNPEAAVREVDEYLFSAFDMKRRRLLEYGVRPEDEYAVVPEGHYLMLGDNSARSQDGRFFGWVPHDHLLGRAFCVWWPFRRWRDLSGFTDTVLGWVLLIGVPFALFAYEYGRAYLLVSMKVRGSFMPNFVRRGDRVFVNRAVLAGVRVPFTRIPIWEGRGPWRGELVAYFAPGGENGAHAGEALLGRVAGVPGDEITIDDGQILVKGERTGVAAQSADGKERDAARWVKKKFSTVPPNNYLVLVDSDAKAPDSRTVGWIPRDHLIGRVAAVWWPPHRIRRFDG